MRVAVNAVLSFGLVNVPVGVAPATTEKENITFKTLHKKCGTPIKQQKVCVTCNADLEPDQTVRGFEYAKGQFVPLTDGEIDSVKPDRSKIIRISKFVSGDEIDPLMVKKTYFLIPNEVLAGAYGILYAGILDTKTVGVGVASIWGKESPCLVSATNGTLMFHTLHTSDEMVTADFSAHIPREEERSMAVKTILSYKETLKPEDLVSTPSILLKQLVAAKVQGLAFEAPPVEKEADLTVDVMEALKRTMARKSHKPQRKRRVTA